MGLFVYALVAPNGSIRYVGQTTAPLNRRLREHLKPIPEETRRKMSLAHQGKRHSPAHVAALTAGITGIPKSDSHRVSLSRARGGSPILVTRLADGFSFTAPTQAEAARALGIWSREVNLCVLGKRGSAHGHSFSRMESQCL